MKKLIALFLALGITLLFGCKDDNSKVQSSVSSKSSDISFSMESNLFSLDFADFYQKISSQLGVKDKNSMALSGVNADNAINFVFTPNGEIKDFEIGFCAKTPRTDIAGEFQRTAYSISNHSAKDTPSSKIKKIYRANINKKDFEIGFCAKTPHTDIAGEFQRTAYSISNHSAKDTPLSQIKKIYQANINKTDEIIDSKDILNYSDFWTQMNFLHQLDLKKIVKQYTVGNPTAFFLRSQYISENYINNLKSNVICLDCTNPSKVKQIARITFPKKCPYAEYFPGIKYYYAIIPYYESGLSVNKMYDEYYDNDTFNNIILLLIRE